MNPEQLKSLLSSARKYVERANADAESRHDNPDGDYYMDYGQYETMMETSQLLADIDAALRGQ